MVNPNISFIVPLFNHLAHTQEMLKTLSASIPVGLEYEVIIVDDFSTDGTRDWLAAFYDPNIKVILNPSNLGFAKSNNIGALRAVGQILGLLNNDLLFAPGWLEPMLAVLESRALKAGCVGDVQYRVANDALDHAGIQLNCAGQFEHIQNLPESEPTYTRVLAVTGACLLIRRADFEQAGGFDEAFVNGCEDVDLCYKLRAARKSIYVESTSRIRHHVSLSRARETLQNVRNSRHLFGKWRATIKNELSAQWVTMLKAGPAAYQPYIHGALKAEFVATPQIAARTIAEAILLRQEYRWARELGEADPNCDVAMRCSVRGLSFNDRYKGYLPKDGRMNAALRKECGGESVRSIEFWVRGLRSARNFYVCGHRIYALPDQTITIKILVNGIQEQTFRLGAEPNFNVGIIDPIVLPGLNNCFKVSFAVHWANEFSVAIPARGGESICLTGHGLDDVSQTVAITHFVVDDKEVVDWLGLTAQ